VDFTDDQIEAARVCVCVGRQCGAEHFQRAAVFEPVEADNCAREVAERVGANASRRRSSRFLSASIT